MAKQTYNTAASYPSSSAAPPPYSVSDTPSPELSVAVHRWGGAVAMGGQSYSKGCGTEAGIVDDGAWVPLRVSSLSVVSLREVRMDCRL